MPIDDQLSQVEQTLAHLEQTLGPAAQTISVLQAQVAQHKHDAEQANAALVVAQTGLAASEAAAEQRLANLHSRLISLGNLAAQIVNAQTGA